MNSIEAIIVLTLENATVDGPVGTNQVDELLCELDHYFGVEFSLWDGITGELVYGSRSQPEGDPFATASMLSAVYQRQEADFIVDRDGILLLAVPLDSCSEAATVATAWFVTSDLNAGDGPENAAKRQSSMPGATLPQEIEMLPWARRQEVWSPRALLRLAEAVRGKRAAEAAAERHAQDVEVISENLASTYEEISLVHAVTQNLRISSTEGDVGQMATEWLAECVPAKGFAVKYVTMPDEGKGAFRAHKSPEFYTAGDCPIDDREFISLIEKAALQRDSQPYIANASVTDTDTWPFPKIRQAIIVPLSEGNKVFGWLAAFNHLEDLEFGTVEAQLLNSLGALLGIHSSNRQLYREQAEFVANVVRALVSAIDAKDPYTSGHSDRVSRVAVRIALELRCNPKIVNTIYMAGLLHDVGKIGINDSVLRKAGHLTDSEFEHIKMHPEMGYRILADLKQLADVLPAVLHHHEQWDGGGYPHGLQGEETPLIARIMAVADAYDAMTSDRPYRQGMSQEKVERIFRDGAGRQWDPNVVNAFFAAKDDIIAIAARERVQLMEQWV